MLRGGDCECKEGGKCGMVFWRWGAGWEKTGVRGEKGERERVMGGELNMGWWTIEELHRWFGGQSEKSKPGPERKKKINRQKLVPSSTLALCLYTLGSLSGGPYIQIKRLLQSSENSPAIVLLRLEMRSFKYKTFRMKRNCCGASKWMDGAPPLKSSSKVVSIWKKFLHCGFEVCNPIWRVPYRWISVTSTAWCLILRILRSPARCDHKRLLVHTVPKTRGKTLLIQVSSNRNPYEVIAKIKIIILLQLIPDFWDYDVNAGKGAERGSRLQSFH